MQRKHICNYHIYMYYAFDNIQFKTFTKLSTELIRQRIYFRTCTLDITHHVGVILGRTSKKSRLFRGHDPYQGPPPAKKVDFFRQNVKKNTQRALKKNFFIETIFLYCHPVVVQVLKKYFKKRAKFFLLLGDGHTHRQTNRRTHRHAYYHIIIYYIHTSVYLTVL